MFLKKLVRKISYILSFVSCSQATLHIGQQAPEFSLIDDCGNVRNLASCKGKKVALVFYPKDGSPYCKRQAESIRDEFKKLTDHNIVVFGLSSDNKEKHISFKKDYNLPFDLLTASKKVLKAYNAYGFFFNARITYLVDENGKIVCIIDDVNIQKHAQQILNGFGITQ